MNFQWSRTRWVNLRCLLSWRHYQAQSLRRLLRRLTRARVRGFESLEPRMLLAAHLSYAEGVGELPLTLTYDPASSQYRLVDSVGQVVSSASGASANGRVEITGTEADDVLLLDLDYLPALQIDFLGGGTDTLAATANADFALTGSTLTVGVTTFTLDGFERAELTGGVSANTFTFGDVTIPAVAVDGGGGSDTILSTVADNAWNIGLGENVTDAGTLGEAIEFTSVKNIVGGTGIDVFTFADEASLTGTLDGGLGSNALDYSAYQSAVTVNLAAQTATGTGGLRNVTGVVGGAGSDTLIGSASDAVWQISGADSGFIEDVVEFSGIENITGSDAGSDFFIIEGEGSISGTLSGGAGGVDGILVYAEDGSYSRLNPKSTAGSHAATVHGKAITYAGLESVLAGNLTSLVIHGSPLRDMWTLADDPAVAGQIVL
ncbi:MAG: LEPR-XLL domain-containing protein, partial [Planctomycetaceae bacterium]